MPKPAIIIPPIITILALLFLDLDPGHPEVTRTAAVAFLMAAWWVTEAIPIAATAMIPVALFPLLGIMKGSEVAAVYFNHLIFLFIGGFIVALAMERWNLHRRIALRIIMTVGAGPRRIIMGFMAATAFLSMWISNTATTMMMVPICMAVISQVEVKAGREKASRFAIGLLLGVAYSASLGGTATIIGTFPNLVLVRTVGLVFPEAPEITFATWMLFALPICLIMLALVWRLLTWIYCPRRDEAPVGMGTFRLEYDRLGRLGFEEGVVLAVFSAMALLWMSRQGLAVGDFKIPGWSALLPWPEMVDDGTVGIAMALLLFFVPARSAKYARVMDWKATRGLPWHVVLLLGGGFALAAGFKESGLSAWLGEHLADLTTLHPLVLVMVVCTVMTFLTELTSNTATTQMALPILAGLAVAVRVNPLFIMVPATICASFAFMLPVATPPNAIAFGTGRLRIATMARTGVLINLVGIVVVTLGAYYLSRLVLGVDLGHFPDWALGE